MTVFGNKKQDMMDNKKNMRLLVNINVKSVSNAITNSSSEVFLVKSERPAEDIKKLIIEYSNMAYSDDGVIDETKLSENSQKIVKEDKINLSNCEDEDGSGMGGDIEVTDFIDASCEYKKFYRKDITEELKKYGLTEEELNHYVLVDIDWARQKTIDFLTDNFETHNCEGALSERLNDIYDILSNAHLNNGW